MSELCPEPPVANVAFAASQRAILRQLRPLAYFAGEGRRRSGLMNRLHLVRRALTLEMNGILLRARERRLDEGTVSPLLPKPGDQKE
jgi:hypothetical protein